MSASRLHPLPRGPSRPGPPDPGVHPLGAGWIAVPEAAPGAPVPLLVLLHGAGSSGRAMVELAGTAVAAAGVLLLAPDATRASWDLVHGGFGADVARIDAALAAIGSRWTVDPGFTVLGGFSDGASYALSLGLANGDRFSHLVAFSPGFMAPDAVHGRPPVYVSHGRDDPVLPVACSHRIVRALRAAGHEVAFTEFAGGHAVPPEIAREALDWVRATPRAG